MFHSIDGQSKVDRKSNLILVLIQSQIVTKLKIMKTMKLDQTPTQSDTGLKLFQENYRGEFETDAC